MIRISDIVSLLDKYERKYIDEYEIAIENDDYAGCVSHICKVDAIAEVKIVLKKALKLKK